MWMLFWSSYSVRGYFIRVRVHVIIWYIALVIGRHILYTYTIRRSILLQTIYHNALVPLQRYSSTPIIILECESYSLFMIKRKLLFVLSINNLQYAYYYWRSVGISVLFIREAATAEDLRLYQFKSALTKPSEFQCIENLHMLYKTWRL